MNKYESAIKALQDGIKKYVDISFDNVKADKTYTALVTGIYSADDNTYNIKLNGVDYQNVSSNGAVCTVNETVKVVYPCNNSNNMYINKFVTHIEYASNIMTITYNNGTVNTITL